MMKDFIVARFGNIYGYLSTDKEQNYGFEKSYKGLIDNLEKTYKDFSYANPDELPVHDHQREWVKNDQFYYNKLRHLKFMDSLQNTRILALKQGHDR